MALSLTFFFFHSVSKGQPGTAFPHCFQVPSIVYLAKIYSSWTLDVSVVRLGPYNGPPGPLLHTITWLFSVYIQIYICFVSSSSQALLQGSPFPLSFFLSCHNRPAKIFHSVPCFLTGSDALCQPLYHGHAYGRQAGHAVKVWTASSAPLSQWWHLASGSLPTAINLKVWVIRVIN